MSRLKDKAKLLDLQNVPAAPRDAASAPRTAIGTLSAVIAMDERSESLRQEMQARIQELEAQLAKANASSAPGTGDDHVEALDPKVIRPSFYANRHDDAFRNEAFLNLKNDIAQTGRNVQPIKVRRIQAAPDADGRSYEIVFGHRRHRACLELNLPVVAIVSEMDDQAMFAEMDRENRDREDLSPWEQGVMYKKAMETELFGSMRKMCEALGVDASIASKALALAELPQEVIDAFGSPLHLQFRWGAPIRDALNENRERVIKECRDLAMMNPRLAPKRVLSRLLGQGSMPMTSQDRLFQRGGKVAGAWKRDGRGEIHVKIKPGMLSGEDEEALQRSLQAMLEKPSERPQG